MLQYFLVVSGNQRPPNGTSFLCWLGMKPKVALNYFTININSTAALVLTHCWVISQRLDGVHHQIALLKLYISGVKAISLSWQNSTPAKENKKTAELLSENDLHAFAFQLSSDTPEFIYRIGWRGVCTNKAAWTNTGSWEKSAQNKQSNKYNRDLVFLAALRPRHILDQEIIWMIYKLVWRRTRDIHTSFCILSSDLLQIFHCWRNILYNE